MRASLPGQHQQPATVLVFGGGNAPTPLDRGRLPAADIVIAADSGADHAIACGVDIDVVVGDLDSVSKVGLATAAAAGAVIEQHPTAKDESDLELALFRALEHQPERIVLTAVSGGRSDHVLSNLLLAASSPLEDVEVEVISGSDRFLVVRGFRRFEVDPGQTVTLLPLHGPAVGVTTTGLQYPLTSETLDAGSTRGLSNVAMTPSVSVAVDTGVLLVVLPWTEDSGP